ncbi:uncharacterized protein LOC115622813 [Scaptodrosophila lebanonensis]|uniref:Uncharacterized protein LOC115622813 n=1 Tax=Drosophila lebanonensis TaxID=7225 RepID=A0A6J2TBI4_DROLE|nr:uncharacterized protein LOC115622813 [Scaptodrosophila lebanonensis]
MTTNLKNAYEMLTKVNSSLEKNRVQVEELRQQMQLLQAIDRKPLLENMNKIVLEQRRLVVVREIIRRQLNSIRNNHIDKLILSNKSNVNEDAHQTGNIENEKDAGKCLKELLEYAVLQQNYRATALLTKAQNAFRDENID